MSPLAEGSYEVAIGRRALYVRVQGLATMNNCLTVRDFIEEMLRTGHDLIVIDLAACRGMDSTFMGVLAGAATFERSGRFPGVAVVNAGPSLVNLLKSVGLTELVFVDPKPFHIPDMEFLRLEEHPGEEERLALIRTAHENLVKISERNEQIFGAYLAALEDEMRGRRL